mgnify:CR=1 FL=1
MRRNPIHVRLLALSLMSGVMFFTSCNDNDYDFNEIDVTVGIGGDKLEIPVSSTDVIKLADVLELEANDCIKEDANGDYVFHQEGGDVAPVHVTISPIVINDRNHHSYDITFLTAMASNGTRALSGGLKAKGKVYEFDYKYTKPVEVVSLLESEVNSNISVNFSLPTGLSSIDKLSMTFPEYMVIKAGKDYELNGNVVTFNNLRSGSQKTIALSKIDFTKGGSNIVNGTNSLEMKGSIEVEAAINTLPSTLPSNLKMTADINIGEIQLKTATGHFKPTINMNNLGNVAISSVPDFLKGGNVNVDLYNPQIKLNISNDMNVEGLVNGVLTAKDKSGRQLAQVSVSGIKVEANKTSKICICRTKEGVTGYDQVIANNQLSSLISTIPDNITFSATAEANSNKTGSFEFGKQYTIQPSYAVDAPIAFAENATIEYKDTLDGWNDDVKDLSLSKDSYILATANVESAVPAYLSVEAVPVGVDHKALSKDDIEVIVEGTVAASADGQTKVSSPLSIKLVQKTEDAVSKLDGIIFLVSGKANGENGAVTGITLNARKHTLVLKDVKIQLVGKVIGDFN